MSSGNEIFEMMAEEEKRIAVVMKLEKIVLHWARIVGKQRGIPPSILKSGGGAQLKIFGSTRLKVHTPDADVDVLLIAPSFISRQDFFHSFCELLTLRVDVSMVSAITDAFTPVLKFYVDKFAVDMVFVSLHIRECLPKFVDVLDNRCLRGLDDHDVRSVNGSRVAEKICNLVPNFQTFCLTLRVIKYWARQRGLYSNVLGFLGGVNYAILVAFVCQRYVNASPSTLVRKFFLLFTQWRWPNPILLTAMEDDGYDKKHMANWNSKLNVRMA